MKSRGRTVLHILFIVFYVSCYYLWILFRNDEAPDKTLVANLFSTAAPLIAAVWLWRRAVRAPKEDRAFWALLSSACFSYTVAEGIWTYYENVLNVEVPFPGWSDLFYVLQIMISLLALLSKMYQKRSSLRAAMSLFDMLIVMTVATTVSWHYLIAPMYTTDDSALSIVVSMAYPVMDLGLLFGLLLLYRTSATILPTKVLLCVAAGFAIQIFADTVYLYQSAAKAYVSGGWVDPLWTLALLTVGLSGVQPERGLDAAASVHTQNKSRRVGASSAVNLSLPYSCVVVMFALIVMERHAIGLIVGSSLSIVLVIVRQVVLLVENESLVRRLQRMTDNLGEMVNVRTRQLSVQNEQLEETMRSMKHLAYHDVLTGLPNRRLFEERVATSFMRAKRNDEMVSVMFLDIDRFKYINDHYGHRAGDALLQDVATRLGSCLHESGTVSRQGGDEFTILLEGIRQPRDVVDMVNGIFDSMKEPFTLEGQEIHITSSIGIAVYPNDGTDLETLMKHADNAMYRAKESGRNRFQFYASGMNEEVSKKVLLESELHKALERSEFSIDYQPLVEAGSGEIVGMEALIRWHHPTRGLVSPAQFIPVAEETGLIVLISDWVLKEACKHVKALHRSGYPDLKVSVNLSMRQFMQDDLVDYIVKVLEETDLEPQYVDLEITESISAYQIDVVIKKLAALHELGVSISIDDFGTGYSSLSYLRKFPIDTLKIDRSFIQDLTVNKEGVSIVKAIIAMAHSLNFQVVAEGVETNEQLDQLKRLGCDLIQGYLFGKPIPGKQWNAFLANYGKSVRSV